MQMRRYLLYILVSGLAIFLVSGGVLAGETPTSTSGAASGAGTTSAPFVSFKNYPDHVFNVREYINGMQKGGHNLLIWRDPSVNLSQYNSVKVSDFGGRLLPEQNVISYDPFITIFNSTFRSSLKLSQTNAPAALLIEGAIVECNPGSRHVRNWIGMGAGKATGAVICEVYEPGKSQPCIRIYTRDYGTMGNWGGNSIALLNNIFSALAYHLAANLNTTLGLK
jgi:Domain of unknown function (DUF4410)